MLPEHILISTQPGRELQAFLTKKQYSKLAVLMDENTMKACYPLIKEFLPVHTTILVKSGEESKTLETCSLIWDRMTEALLDRHAALIVLGGGVLGDMGGFCAATYKRGIDFILVPTTLLAQADASIGGKLGIDFKSLKNHIGIFQEPVLTVLHSGFLKTLPEAELRSGFAEVIKHALISDKELWDELRTNDLAHQSWDSLLKKSAEFKYSVIQQDPREKGLRKILNAGHTIGHALESFYLANGSKILHGEAIAAGLIAEAYLGMNRQLLDETSLHQMVTYILSIFGKLRIAEDQIPLIAALCLQDKKNKGNSVLCVLPEGIGSARWDVEISLREIEDGLSFYRLLQT